ncbi:MAG TPA: DNA-3-methyladenine glycosylase I [Chloroflexota bacterium]|nr:DNA-3-methyladenine glycosylase I [Chloroflexota bacterium]
MPEPRADGRCSWAGSDPLMEAYHDREWGVPMHDDRALFELLSLEGAQAGLSWSTILKRREGYRRAFAQFDLQSVASFGDADLQRLLADTEIIRNRQKIIATIGNAQRVLDLQREHGSFDRFVWSFVANASLVRQTMTDIPALTPESTALSKALKKRGFGFVGPTIVYAFMQSAGLVNDHVVTCPAWSRIEAARG